MAATEKLTQHAVDALTKTGKDYKVFDTQVPGFHVRVFPSGRKCYAFGYRTEDGRQRSIALGKAVEGVKVEAVRRKARELLVAVQKGEDPSAERNASRRASTMDELFDEYLVKHARPRKRPRSLAEDERNWRTHLSPRFGRMRVTELSKRDLDGFMSDMKERPGAANRCMALLSTLMNLAVDWEYRADNPCRKVERYPENQVQRFLSDKEASALLAALDEEEDRGAAKAIEFLLLTGARRGEVLNATWQQFDLDGDAPVWVVPRTVIKSRARIRADLRRPLSREAADLLRAWKVEAKVTSLSWVFPSAREPSKPRADLNDPWDRVRAAAGIAEVRLHDLRHSFASAAVNAGSSLYLVGQALGHRDVRTTQRYAHVMDGAVRAAADAVGRFASRRVRENAPH